MRKVIVITFALILMIPALMYSDTFTLRVGYYMPKTSTNPNSLWDTEFSQMNYKKADFRGTILGASYEHFLTRQLSFAITVDSYNRERLGTYTDWIGVQFTDGDFAFPTDFQGDFYISHVFNVRVTPVQLSLKFAPLGRKTPVI